MQADVGEEEIDVVPLVRHGPGLVGRPGRQRLVTHILNDSLGQHPHLLLVFDDQHHSHAGAPLVR